MRGPPTLVRVSEVSRPFFFVQVSAESTPALVRDGGWPQSFRSNTVSQFCAVISVLPF
jgi:hypothetical protein